MWIRSFQEGRSQQVKLVDAVSSVKPCPAGVPEGSVISPILFKVHVNDPRESVPQHLIVNICRCADDCTLDTLVGSDKDRHVQEVLNSMDGWAQETVLSKGVS